MALSFGGISDGSRSSWLDDDDGGDDLKFMFSKKAKKIDKIFIVDLTLCSKCQIDGEDFVFFGGLLRKHEL